jgi:hypothetical protein
VRVDQIRLAKALETSRQGIQHAQEQAGRAAARLANLESQRVVHTAEQQQREVERLSQSRKDYVRDMIELTRSQTATRANAKVLRSSEAASAEVINLGRRIDVRA